LADIGEGHHTPRFLGVLIGAKVGRLIAEYHVSIDVVVVITCKESRSKYIGWTTLRRGNEIATAGTHGVFGIGE
jgi:hypothetical protein